MSWLKIFGFTVGIGIYVISVVNKKTQVIREHKPTNSPVDHFPMNEANQKKEKIGVFALITNDGPADHFCYCVQEKEIADQLRSEKYEKMDKKIKLENERREY